VFRPTLVGARAGSSYAVLPFAADFNINRGAPGAETWNYRYQASSRVITLIYTSQTGTSRTTYFDVVDSVGYDTSNSVSNYDFEGGQGNDVLITSAGTDQLDGGDGDDKLFGMGGEDALFGGADNDMLLGGDDGDRLEGEGGDDLLDGGAGNDVYVINAGDGRDISSSITGADTLRFTVAFESISLGQSKDASGIEYLVLNTAGGTFDAATNTITTTSANTSANGGDGSDDTHYVAISNGFSGVNQKFEFAGDISFASFDEFYAAVNKPTYQRQGSGKIGGGRQDDRLEGDITDDELAGGSGNDTYVVNRYGGNERIIDDEGSNIIKFGVGITPDDVSVQWLGTSGAAESGLKIRIGIGAGNV